MAHIYFDESIQDRGSFILGAVVVGPDAEPDVTRAMLDVGLRPGTDEFKSSARMSEHPEQVRLREALWALVPRYRVGVVVLPFRDRPLLGEYALQALDQFSRANELTRDPDLEVFLDQGLFPSPRHAARIAASLGVDKYSRVSPEQDSRVIKGLQLADLVAHTAGLMLLDGLGLLKKVVKAGPNSGYDEDMEIELGFEMWAGLRYHFFYEGPVANQDDIYAGALRKVGRNGLFITDSCSPDLRAAAIDRFDECYVGCIH